MKTTTYICDPRPAYKFKVTAVRWTPENPPTEGVTLVLAHGNAMHKETWSTLVSFLFDLASRNQFTPVVDVWSIECPNHGESAVLNEAELASHYSVAKWDGWEYTRTMLAFLNSRPGGINFYERNLVAMGHSNGGSACVLLHDLEPRLPLSGFVLLDPAATPPSKARDRMERIITAYTWTRQDTWLDRNSARRYLESGVGTRFWHPRVIDAFVAKGLRVHPAAVYSDPFKFNGVTLACTKVYESSMTRANEVFPHAFDVLHQMYRARTPVHLILSTADKFGGQVMKDAMMRGDPVSGRKPTSVQLMERGGHMFVQTEPEAAARAVYNALCAIVGKGAKAEENSEVPLRAHL